MLAVPPWNAAPKTACNGRWGRAGGRCGRALVPHAKPFAGLAGWAEAARASCARSKNRCSLPLGVFGRSATNWHGPVWHGPVWHGPVWHDPVRRGIAQHCRAAATAGPGRAGPHGMAQPVVAADDHAQLGLAVVVHDCDAQALPDPAHDLGTQRLPGAAEGAELAAQPRQAAVGDQQAEGGRRPGQVGEAVPPQRIQRAGGGKGAVMERGGLAEQQRAITA